MSFQGSKGMEFWSFYVKTLKLNVPLFANPIFFIIPRVDDLFTHLTYLIHHAFAWVLKLTQ